MKNCKNAQFADIGDERLAHRSGMRGDSLETGPQIYDDIDGQIDRSIVDKDRGNIQK